MGESLQPTPLSAEEIAALRIEVVRPYPHYSFRARRLLATIDARDAEIADQKRRLAAFEKWANLRRGDDE